MTPRPLKTAGDPPGPIHVKPGATLGQTKRLYQGLFLSPTIIGESLKGSMLLAEVFGARFGFPCNPPPGAFRTDIIQALQVGSKDRILQFCKQVSQVPPMVDNW